MPWEAVSQIRGNFSAGLEAAGFYVSGERDYMNHIEVKSIKTCYDYSEYYFLIDGKPVTVCLDEYIQCNAVNSLSAYGSMLGLMPAWGGELIWQWENDFIWELVDSVQELNVPILVCEDDCDLSCIVIMVHIRKAGDRVYWDRIGALDHSKGNRKEEQESGILCLEAYTDEDWERYGDNIATEKYGSRAYWKWVSENCYEEHIRRLRNYMRPYMQKDENIEWIQELHWEFAAGEYELAVEQYREQKRLQDKKKLYV